MREYDHTSTLDSGKLVQKYDVSISVGGFDLESLATQDKSSPRRPTDPCKEMALQATVEHRLDLTMTIGRCNGNGKPSHLFGLF